MKRIDTATRQIDKFGPGKDGFRNGDPASALLATKLNADMFDHLQEQPARFIESVGIALDDSDYDQMTKAAAKVAQNAAMTYAADTGAVNAYVITLTPAVTAYVEGQGFSFKVAHTNTGAATLKVNALAAKAIIRPDGNALQAGDLVAGEMVDVRYDGASFQISSPWSVKTPTALDNTTKPANTAWIWTNIQALVASCIAAVATAAGFVVSTNYIAFPSWLGGLIIQWLTVTATSPQAATWPITFPTRCVFVVPVTASASNTTYGVNVAGNSSTGTTAYPNSGGGGVTVSLGLLVFGF